MKKIIFLFLFVTFSCNNKPKKVVIINKKFVPTFLIYGALAPVGYTEEQDSTIAKKFGFNIKRVADCDVTSKLEDSVKIINGKNDKFMRKNYGKNWVKNFEKKSNLKMAIPNIEK